MKLSEELTWRGFVNQTTLTNTDPIDKEQLTFYWGVDPSAESMTVGNFAMAMMALHFVKHGHKAVLLVGGATGMIGDPDGKDSERDLKPLGEIERNKLAIKRQYEHIFSGYDIEIVDNYEWFKNINYLDFLRDVGKYFSMTQLLQRDFIQNRIGPDGSGISYAEFSYSLIQGYDFLYLYREYGATLQLAASDQWGNALSGTNLIRKLDGGEAHIWTGPLIINTKTGKKFGKSEEGAVWLSSRKTSAFKFYQFWLNVDDVGVEQYLKIYTFIDLAEYEELIEKSKNEPHKRYAQKWLAYEVTRFVHGDETAKKVRRTSESLFDSQIFRSLTTAEIMLMKTEFPTIKSSVPINVIKALTTVGLAKSNSEASRSITAGAVSVNGIKIKENINIHDQNEVNTITRNTDQVFNKPTLIRYGKNSFCLII